jgi:hypothetical protein
VVGSRHRRWQGSLAFALIACSGCASIPAARYGVESVRFRGVSQVDPESIAACLGTRQRPRFRIDLGLRGTPACGEPPFDAGHLNLDFWSWPWEDWPLFDESVFERDVERIERWYRARGFYDARVTATDVEPSTATRSEREGEEGCGAGEGSDCTVDVIFSVEEGEPSTVARMALRGIEELPEGMREQLRGVLQFHRGDRFDEALYQDTKRRMLRVLADAGYASASVGGQVKVSASRHEVYVIFRITPGEPSVIGRVCVIGYGELPPQPMLDVAGIDAGSTFSLSGLEEAQRALYALGTFSGVEVAPRRDRQEESEEEAPADTGGQPERPEAQVAVSSGEDVRRVCNPGPSSIPSGHRAVDIDIRVTPGRITSFGFGVGLQAGQAVTFGTVTSFATQQNAAQWDVHVSTVLEHRNLFDRLIRGHLEVRPRLIFQMPFLNFTPAQPSPFGVQTTGSLRWPAFLEPRTNFLVEVRHDLGPMPFTNFFRSELDGFTGVERTFFDGRLYGGVFLHGNWFVPTDRQPIDPAQQLPETWALWLEEAVRLDLRDDPRNPTAGAYFGVSSQQAVRPLGSWDFVRFVGEVRGYVPLPFGIVLAGRFQIGVMEVFGSDLAPNNVYQLDQLGPPALQLTGGGASSNRGYLPGLLGDAEQIDVVYPRSAEEVANGAPSHTRPVRISGGTRMWEASLELRIPITPNLGVVLFGDAGDVDRDRLGVDDGPARFRFDYPQLAFGLGIRYRTIVGPIRFDVAVRPDQLQVLGSPNTLPPDCGPTLGQGCRPVPYVDLFNMGLLRFPGAFHLTIGEAF